MSDDEKEGQEENNLFELENMNDFASPDTTFVDFNTTYEPGQFVFTDLCQPARRIFTVRN